KLGRRAAITILENREARIHLSEDIYVPEGDEVGLGALEAALEKAVRAMPIETKMRNAVREGRLERAPGHMLDDMALAAGVISEEEYQLLDTAREARRQV